MAQLSPVFGMQTADFNNDGNLDIMLAGNDYATEVFNGRLDAGNGMILQGDGNGNFNALPASKTGFFVAGNAKAMASVFDKN